MELLLLSNSTNFGEPYLDWCKEYVASFLKDKNEIVFIPYAGVTISNEEYEEKVNIGLSQLKIVVKSIHRYTNEKEALINADAIVVGGGNTFVLLKTLYEKNLLNLIKDKVSSGEAKYVGWSAGSNVAGIGINTSNDMPIAFPPSFDAIGMVPFMINPHFTNKVIENHGGESRIQRLKEFMEVNNSEIMTMEEGSGVKISNNVMNKIGVKAVSILSKNTEDRPLMQNEIYTIN